MKTALTVAVSVVAGLVCATLIWMVCWAIVVKVLNPYIQWLGQ